MSEFAFRIDIENPNTGRVLGNGPLASATRWEYTARFDRAGSIAFAFDASDPVARHVTNTRVARAWALLGDVWTEVGAGRIDQLGMTPLADGSVTYGASGLDLIGELGYRSVRKLEIGKPSGTDHATALAAIVDYAPTGWSFTAAPDPGNDYIYARYDGESVLGALVYLAERTQTHFYRGVNRTLHFTGSFEDSGIRAVVPHGGLGENECAITQLSETIDTHGLLTRIYPYGSGTGTARLDLSATTRSAPAGYVLNKTENYIEDLEASALYGVRDHPEIEFKEITTISNTQANRRGAANMLFDAALAELRRRSSLAAQRTYTLEVAGCSYLLRPMQTIRVVYRDIDQGIDIDEDLKILEATWSMDTKGIETTRLVVSTDDRWPESDASAAAERAVQGRVFQAHPQLGPNSYWENGVLYVGSDQANHVAEFPFVFGPEVSTIDRVRFRYKVTEPLSFISVVAGAIDIPIDIDVAVDSVSVSGTINIEHDHPVTLPAHSHPIAILDTSSPGSPSMKTLFFDISNDLLAVAVAGTDTFDYAATSEDGGDEIITSSAGGSTSLALTGSGTGNGTGSTTLDLSGAIGVSYGVYKAPASRSYTIDDLEYAVNGAAWADLDTGIATGDGYYELDITAEVQDADDFTPLQENNVIEIRRKTDVTSLAIDSSQGDGVTVGVSTSPVQHELAVGEQVIITGTTDHNGVYLVVEISNEYVFRVNKSGDTNTNSGGTLTINKSAMILAKLGVVSFIQAISLT